MKVDKAVAAAAGNRYYGVGGIRAFQAFFANYVNFTGRSTRREYWWSYLWTLLITWGILLIWLVSLFGSVTQLLSGSTDNLSGGRVAMLIVGLVVLLIYALALIVPSLAIAIRRFRDAGVHWLIFVVLEGVSDVGLAMNASNPQGIAGLVIGWAAALAIFVITVLPSKNPPHPEEESESYR